MSLETLGQRWGWEKTKVWRFFQKHGDAFALYRLPGSYGCLIFNKQYPTGTAGPVLKEEDIVQLFQRFRSYASGASCTRSGLNKLIRLYSHAVVAQMGLEEREEPAKNRVAVLPLYIARIFFSVGTVRIAGVTYMTAGVWTIGRQEREARDGTRMGRWI